MAKSVLGIAVSARGMVNVVGEPGAGKTEAVSRAIKDFRVVVVKVESPDKGNLKIGAIIEALIYDLSDERPRRSQEARARQIRRIIGEASRREEIVLWLEEGHRIHHMTLRSLKSLREMQWMGQSPLFTVVFCSQCEQLHSKDLREIRIRTDTLTMEGMSQKEARLYIEETVGERFDTDAADALTRCAHKTPMGVREAAIRCMQKALEYGRKQVETIDVLEALKGGMKEVARSYGLSDGELSKLTGHSASTINQVINDKPPSTMRAEKVEEVRASVMDVIKKRMAGKDNCRLSKAVSA
ncbi:MAG: AAA family ATPase [Candidatus Hydrothermarchaeales archaeon]